MTAEERAQQAIPAHQHLQYAVAAAIKSAVEAELRRLIPLVCERCGVGSEPSRAHGSGRGSSNDPFEWFHRISRDPYTVYCEASPLHEALRKETDSGD